MILAYKLSLVVKLQITLIRQFHLIAVAAFLNLSDVELRIVLLYIFLDVGGNHRSRHRSPHAAIYLQPHTLQVEFYL